MGGEGEQGVRGDPGIKGKEGPPGDPGLTGVRVSDAVVHTQYHIHILLDTSKHYRIECSQLVHNMRV